MPYTVWISFRIELSDKQSDGMHVECASLHTAKFVSSSTDKLRFVVGMQSLIPKVSHL